VKRPAGSSVLRRLRSRSLRFGRRPFRGIALAKASRSSTQIHVAQRSTWHSTGAQWSGDGQDGLALAP
jgi:hypothetical protein